MKQSDNGQVRAMFAPGELTCTSDAKSAIQKAGIAGLLLVYRHIRGDWECFLLVISTRSITICKLTTFYHNKQYSKYQISGRCYENFTG